MCLAELFDIQNSFSSLLDFNYSEVGSHHVFLHRTSLLIRHYYVAWCQHSRRYVFSFPRYINSFGRSSVKIMLTHTIKQFVFKTNTPETNNGRLINATWRDSACTSISLFHSNKYKNNRNPIKLRKIVLDFTIHNYFLEFDKFHVSQRRKHIQ